MSCSLPNLVGFQFHVMKKSSSDGTLSCILIIPTEDTEMNWFLPVSCAHIRLRTGPFSVGLNFKAVKKMLP